MLDIYTVLKCESCRKEFILLSEDIDKMTKDRYIACPYCNSKRVNKIKTTSDFRECMKERVYKREKGALRQLK